MIDPRLQDAADWAGRVDNADDVTLRLFEAWRADPKNDAAWCSINDAQRSAVALADHPALLAFRHAAIARTVRDRAYRATYRPWAFAAAACAVLAVPSGWTLFSDTKGPTIFAAAPLYRTDLGQRLVATLPDGSKLTLNTNSCVQLAYSSTERRLILKQGQALFEVAKHQGRPFVVVAGGQEVTAHGTQFDVRIEPETTQVALIEGNVTVAPVAAPRGPATSMNVDDVLTATRTGVVIRHVPGDASALASWSEGRLVFADQTLSSAVAEMNRYSSRPITIVDPRAGDLRISGSFRTGEVAPFISALQDGFPVTVRGGSSGPIKIAYRR